MNTYRCLEAERGLVEAATVGDASQQRVLNQTIEQTLHL